MLTVDHMLLKALTSRSQNKIEDKKFKFEKFIYYI